MIIEVSKVSKTFTVTDRKQNATKEINAVKNINFNVSKGEKLAFIGPNGAGKSTTIKMLTGILMPSQGEIVVDGLDPQKNIKKLAKSIGTVFGQREQLWINLTPYDNLMFLALTYGINKRDAEKIIKEFEIFFEIEDIVNVPIKKLSLGQKMKCEMIAGLVHRPKLLFLDEPTIGLDIVAKNNILNVIDKMNKEFGTTVFFTSHDVSDIEKLCDRVILINKGEIVVDDQLESIKKNYFKKKKICITLKNEPSAKIKEEYKLVCLDGYKFVLDVKNEELEIGRVISDFDSNNIIDITIQDSSLESIIADIYNG